MPCLPKLELVTVNCICLQQHPLPGAASAIFSGQQSNVERLLFVRHTLQGMLILLCVRGQALLPPAVRNAVVAAQPRVSAVLQRAAVTGACIPLQDASNKTSKFFSWVVQ